MLDIPLAPEGIDFSAEFGHEMDYGNEFNFGLFFGTDFASMFSFDKDSSSHQTMFLFLFLMRVGVHAVLAAGDVGGLDALIVTFVLIVCRLLVGI
jgi:hypothetical protein